MAVNYSDLSVGGPVGYVLTIDGCPYAFATAEVSSVSFTGDRPGGWCSSVIEWTILSGFLQRPTGWSERIVPVETDLQVSNMTFQIHDAIAPSGVASGSNVMTWLGAATRSLSRTVLSSTISASATSITVDNGAVFGVGGGGSEYVVYLEREAIYIDSRASNTLTVNASGRGVYGSKARIHTVDAASAFKPAVFNAFPWLARHRVILWMGTVTAAGVLADPVPMWRGIIANAPRLATGGALWEIACDHLWQSMGDVMLGVATEACRTKGYTSVGGAASFPTVAARVSVGTTAGGTWYATNAVVPVPGYYDSKERLAGAMTAALNAEFTRLGVSASAVVQGDAGVLRSTIVSVSGGTYAAVSLNAPFASESNAYGTTGATVQIAYPDGAQLVDTSYPNTPLYMASVNMLPTSWTQPSDSAGVRSYVAIAMLTAKVGDKNIVLDPSQYRRSGSEPVNASLRSVSGQLYVNPGGDANIPGLWHMSAGSRRWLLGEIPFQLVWMVTANDWLYALRSAIVNDTIMDGTPAEVDTSDHEWNWDREHRAYELTPGQLAQRQWTLDGQLSLRDLVTECVRFSGACVAIRYGALCVDAIRPPLRSELCDTAHTIAVADLRGGSIPAWHQLPEGLANVVDVSFKDNGTDVRYVINDRSSMGRFGPRRRIELTPRGLRLTPEIRALGPRFIGDFMMSRIIGLWGQLTETITVETSAAATLSNVWLGDTVNITDWISPNQSRGRGWTTRKAIVIGRDVSLTDGSIKLECLAWGESNVSGFSPCVRLSDITTNVCTAASAYANGSDYAGSDATGYASTTDGTVANDRGTGRFKVNDRVELVERDNVTPRTPESRYITAVDTAARTITLDSNPNAAWQAIIAGGGIVEMRYDDYTTASLQTTQKDYAWIGDRATLVIGATTDAVFQWLP